MDGVVFRPLYPATPARDAQLPLDDTALWQRRFDALALEFADQTSVEFDSVGCFRSSQTILAADQCVYSDWSLSERMFP